MKTFTKKGAQKIAITEPVGPQTAANSVSVTMAADQGRTAQTSEQTALLMEMRDYIRNIHDVLLKARL